MCGILEAVILDKPIPKFFCCPMTCTLQEGISASDCKPPVQSHYLTRYEYIYIDGWIALTGQANKLRGDTRADHGAEIWSYPMHHGLDEGQHEHLIAVQSKRLFAAFEALVQLQFS